MNRLALQTVCVFSLVLGVLTTIAWTATRNYPGTLITLTTVAFLVAGLAFGKLEQRR